MNAARHLNGFRIIKVGPNLFQRMEHCVAARHRKAIVHRLRQFCQQLEGDMEPEPWTALNAPMVLLLADVCEALTLNEGERSEVLGQQGEQAPAEILGARPILQQQTVLNGRQAKALAHVRKHGAINLSAYRQLCPGFSDETLRRDLADLAARNLFVKNGRKKGTYYTPAV